jgi:hypothetical protein
MLADVENADAAGDAAQGRNYLITVFATIKMIVG